MGCIGRYFQAHAKGGATARNEYICKKMSEDIVVFGSSRCVHHYVPALIEDSLHLSCYNAGTDGNGIILLYAKWKMLSARYTPKMIIYDVNEEFDLMPGDNTRYLGDMRPYYSMEGVDSIMWSVDCNERYKMCSQMYRYNSIWLQMLSDNIKPLSSDEKGFVAVNRVMDYDSGEHSSPVVTEYDNLKLFYLKKLVSDCKRDGVKLLFCLSPMYKSRNSDIFKPIFEICAENDIPVIDYYSNHDFTTKRDFFYDSVHMNKKGAFAFTKSLIGNLKLYI